MVILRILCAIFECIIQDNNLSFHFTFSALNLFFETSRTSKVPSINGMLNNPLRVGQNYLCRGFPGGQWLRIRLSMQETWVQALVPEDTTCRGATKPMHHNYWACTLEPTSHNYWARVPQLLKPMCLEPMLRNNRSHRNEKPAHRNEE